MKAKSKKRNQGWPGKNNGGKKKGVEGPHIASAAWGTASLGVRYCPGGEKETRPRQPRI